MPCGGGPLLLPTRLDITSSIVILRGCTLPGVPELYEKVRFIDKTGLKKKENTLWLLGDSKRKKVSLWLIDCDELYECLN